MRREGKARTCPLRREARTSPSSLRSEGGGGLRHPYEERGMQEHAFMEEEEGKAWSFAKRGGCKTLPFPKREEGKDVLVRREGSHLAYAKGREGKASPFTKQGKEGKA